MEAFLVQVVMWPCLVAGEDHRVWRMEEADHRHRPDWWDVNPFRALEAFRPQLEDVKDQLQMMEALDQSWLEVLEGKNRM